MKKIFLCVLFLMLFLITGCTNSLYKNKVKTVSEIGEVFTNSNNHKMEMTIIASIFNINSTTEVDGDSSHTKTNITTIFGNSSKEYYISKEDDVLYKYSVDETGKVTKSKYDQTEEEDQSGLGDSWKILFDDEIYSFNESESMYSLKDTETITEDEMVFTNVEIKIGDNEEYFTLSFDVSSSGLTGEIKIVISEIGKINLIIPK